MTHDARVPMSAGRHLTVRLRGTRGGVARFHIAGVAAGLGMRETPSQDKQMATYVGTYVIRPGDAASLAAITATLRVGESELIKASDRPVAIDARPPEIVTRLPEPGARLANLRPNIVLRFYDGESSVDPARVGLLINGRDVTSRTAITQAFAAYTPEHAFQPGPVRVQAIVRDGAGNVNRVDWSFTVTQPPGLIKSVTVSSATGLKPGDYLAVVMAGVPAGRASLTVEGASRGIPMRESAGAPGTYVGMYPIGFQHQGTLIQVTARLRKGSLSSTATAIGAVPVMGQTPRPSVAMPDKTVAGDDQTIQQIMVRGGARPGYHVVAVLSARMESTEGGAWTPLLGASTSTRKDGSWRLSLGPVVLWPHAALFLTVVAVDPLGQRSPPVTLALGASTTPREAVEPAPEEPKKGSQEATSGAPVIPAPQPAPSTQPAPSPVPRAAAPRCPSGQVVDPKTNQCVTAEPGSADEERERNPSASPPAEPPAETPEPPTNPNPGPNPNKPNDPKTGSPSSP